MSDRTQKHIKLAEELQELVLKHAKEKLIDGTISAGEFSTVVKLLMDQGWSFDPNDLPSDLKTKLTQNIDPRSLPDPEDYGINVEA